MSFLRFLTDGVFKGYRMPRRDSQERGLAQKLDDVKNHCTISEDPKMLQSGQFQRELEVSFAPLLNKQGEFCVLIIAFLDRRLLCCNSVLNGVSTHNPNGLSP
jgi:hypothetical protein